MKALLVAVILALADLVLLVYFPRYRSLKFARWSGQISHSKILPLLKACFQGMLIGQIGIYSRINFQVISKKEIYPPGSRVREIFQMPAIIKSPPPPSVWIS